MKIFRVKLRDLIGTNRNPQSWAPRDILLNAQLRFLEKNFHVVGVKGHKAEVDAPKDGSPITFTCEVSTRENVHHVIDHIVEGDWGDFRVKELTVWNEDSRYDWLKVRFFVECTSSEVPFRVGGSE